MAGYYDFVLGIVPIALLGVPATLYVGGIPSLAAIPVGAAVAAAVIGHAMFVRGPSGDRRGRARDTSGVAPRDPSGPTGNVGQSAD